jgi:hypothetical protein
MRQEVPISRDEWDVHKIINFYFYDNLSKYKYDSFEVEFWFSDL